jgi:hypothetical protein
LALAAAGATPAQVFSDWNAQLSQLIIPGTLSEMYAPRRAHLIKQMQCWFCMVPPGATAQTIPYAFVEQFLHTVEQLLEVYLLSAKLQTSPLAATSHFNVSTAAAWQAKDPLDYWTILTAAKSAKLPPAHQGPAGNSGTARGKAGYT